MCVDGQDLSDDALEHVFVTHQRPEHVPSNTRYDLESDDDEENWGKVRERGTIRHLLPSSKRFRIYKYRNPRTARLKTLFKCDVNECRKTFIKLHNFLDHLRTHTG
jgi:hypothetical protein